MEMHRCAIFCALLWVCLNAVAGHNNIIKKNIPLKITDLYPDGNFPGELTSISCVAPGPKCYAVSQVGPGSKIFVIDVANKTVNPSFHAAKLVGAQQLVVIAVGPAAKGDAVHGVAAGTGPIVHKDGDMFTRSEGGYVVSQGVMMDPTGQYVLVSSGMKSVLFSNDYAKTFTTVPVTAAVPMECTTQSVALVDAATWYITWGSSTSMRNGVGSSYCAAITRTMDGGKTWETLVSDARSPFFFTGLSCYDVNNCMAVGEGFSEEGGAVVYHTTNGTTWSKAFAIPSWLSETWSLTAVQYVAPTTVWIAGSTQGPTQSHAVFMMTSDGGRTWYNPVTYGGVTTVLEISFLSENEGYAVVQTEKGPSTVLYLDVTKKNQGSVFN